MDGQRGRQAGGSVPEDALKEVNPGEHASWRMKSLHHIRLMLQGDFSVRITVALGQYRGLTLASDECASEACTTSLLNASYP